jgi:hypothetical protein
MPVFRLLARGRVRVWVRRKCGLGWVLSSRNGHHRQSLGHPTAHYIGAIKPGEIIVTAG